MDNVIKPRMGSKFGQIGPWIVELADLEHLENPHGLVNLENPHGLVNGRNVVTTLVLSILIGSSLFLQIIRTIIKAWMRLNFIKVSSPIMKLAPLEHHKN